MRRVGFFVFRRNHLEIVYIGNQRKGTAAIPFHVYIANIVNKSYGSARSCRDSFTNHAIRQFYAHAGLETLFYALNLVWFQLLIHALSLLTGAAALPRL